MSAPAAQPLAIGALGGSGTRVVAEIVQSAGVYIGSTLNRANDNLVVTRLLKDTAWRRRADATQVRRRLRLLGRLMTGTASPLDRIRLVEAAQRNRTHPFPLSETLQAVRDERGTTGRWGWKEPNTQLFAGDVLETWPEARYVHVLRHGLDMALSKNQNQLRNWGWLFGIDVPPDATESDLRRAQLRYWVASTQHVMDAVADHSDRVHVLRLDELLDRPREVIAELLDFAQLPADDDLLTELAALPASPDTRGRHRDVPLTDFPAEDVAYVASMGFPVEATP